MKKIIFTLFLMIGAICANAQTAKIYKGGTVVQTIDNIDSVRFSQETTTIDIPSYAFSVAADKKVLFSSGNLQYTQSTNSWAFAEHQYDIIGEANIIGGALADKIDLFGWSASNTTAPFGVSLSTDKADYAGNFVDWGTNTIGSDAPNTWRTLTNDEWAYLFQHTCWTMAKVNDLLGLMLLPDGFVAPAGLTVAVLSDGNLSGKDLSFSEFDYASNVYTTDQFAQLESLGVVFLPCAGYRNGSEVNSVGSYGCIWLATPNDADNIWQVYFESAEVLLDTWFRNIGQSVRLVKDFGEPAMPSGKFSVAADKQITFSSGNLQYTQSTNTWAFAANQYDIIGEANIIGGALADKIDLFGWSTDNTATPFGISLSTDKADYAGDFVDWGTNTIGTDAPNTWRTLTKDEWAYLFQHTHWTMAKVNDLLGLMLLPDGFVAPAGLTVAVLSDGNLSGKDLSFSESDYASNVYTTDLFAQLESLGVVFLPSAGYRNGSNVITVGSYGAYWSATPNGSDNTKYLGFSSLNAGTYDWGNRDGGRLVRLVRDVQAPAAGSPAHTSAGSTEEITTQVVTIYQPGGKVSRFNDVDSVVFVETAAVTPSGKFSISADKQVAFAPGNLQYTQSTNTWAFAEHQYDLIGEANIIGGALADKIDLFGWSASNTTAPFGVSLSMDKADYAGDFVDWGTNTIGTDAPNTWRTLTKDEWTYLFQHTHWTMAKVNGVLGLMLLPDGFIAPTGITITILGDGTLSDSGFNFNESEYAGNVYTADVFAQLESLGVVFMPCAGYRHDATVDNVGSYGSIWLATSDGADNVLQIYFESEEVLLDTWYRNIGLSVRLVKDL